MARVAVYEGDFGQADAQEFVLESLKGGAIGGGSVILTDFIIEKVFPTVSPTIKALLSMALPLGVAVYVKENNPSLAMGLALGGASVGMYKLISSLLASQGVSYSGDIVPIRRPMTLAEYAGLGKLELTDIQRTGNVENLEVAFNE